MPSRKRVEYGLSTDITIARPSGDQLGRPGSLSGSCALRTSPVLTSTMRSSDVGERNAICVPSGDHARAHRQRRELALAAARQLTQPQIHRPVAIAAKRRAPIRRATTPDRLRRTRQWSGAPARRFPSAGISQRSPSAPNTTCAPSGEIAGCVMPRTGLRALRRERVVLGSECRPGEDHGSGEFDGACGAAVRRAALDLAVGGVEELGRRRPTAAGTETRPRRRRRCPCRRPSAARRRRPMPRRARQDSTTARVRP